MIAVLNCLIKFIVDFKLKYKVIRKLPLEIYELDLLKDGDKVSIIELYRDGRVIGKFQALVSYNNYQTIWFSISEGETIRSFQLDRINYGYSWLIVKLL